MKAQLTETAGRDRDNLGTFNLNRGAETGEWRAAGAFPAGVGECTIRPGNRERSIIVRSESVS